MSSSVARTEFVFTYEAIEAALLELRSLGWVKEAPGRPLAADPVSQAIMPMELERVLRVAWVQQEAGDFNVRNLRDSAAYLEAEIKRLEREATKMQREWDSSRWAKIEAEELERIQRCLRVVLKATRRFHSKRKRFVQAWETLEKWVLDEGID